MTPRARLRACWLSFDELADRTHSDPIRGEGVPRSPFGRSLSADHRQALDELVAAGEIEALVANVVQEAYAGAIYHIWRSNAGMTCYRMVMPHFEIASARQLVQQLAILAQMAEQDHLDPETVAAARQAIERDMAFEALTKGEVEELYRKLFDEFRQGEKARPSFDKATFDITPEAQKAAQFLIDLLTQR